MIFHDIGIGTFVALDVDRKEKVTCIFLVLGRNQGMFFSYWLLLNWVFEWYIFGKTAKRDDSNQIGTFRHYSFTIVHLGCGPPWYQRSTKRMWTLYFPTREGTENFMWIHEKIHLQDVFVAMILYFTDCQFAIWICTVKSSLDLVHVGVTIWLSRPFVWWTQWWTQV